VTRQRLKPLDADSQELCLIPVRVSSQLRERALKLSIDVPSFSKATAIVNDYAGANLFSEDGLWRLVQGEAIDLDEKQLQEIEQSAILPEPTYTAPNIYDEDARELVVMTDAIGVKAQKPTRERSGQPKKTKEAKRHDTDVIVLPRPDGTKHFLCDGITGRWSLVDAARAFLRTMWPGENHPITALTDGATCIRAFLLAVFGPAIFIILDWYHLEKRVYQQLSMTAHSSSERKLWEKKVLGCLWHGHVQEAVGFLKAIEPRNVKAREDLVGYLEKHRAEIIDYERRQKTGKPIGSGRMEKAVDQVIGMRQKKKGMSWSAKGSEAGAVLTHGSN